MGGFFMASNTKEKQREYDKKRAGTRRRNINLVIYPDDLPGDYETILRGVAPGFLSPLHDKDKNDDGSDKKLHRHVVLHFAHEQTVSQVTELLKGLFGAVGDSIKGVATPQLCGNLTGSVRYLVHADNPEKAQYPRSDIQAWGGMSVDKVWGDDGEQVRMALVRMEEICETLGICEISDLSRHLRQHEEWELYDVLTRRCTSYMTSYITSRRHRAERKAEGQYERASDVVQLDEVPKTDPATGEVIA